MSRGLFIDFNLGIQGEFFVLIRMVIGYFQQACGLGLWSLSGMLGILDRGGCGFGLRRTETELNSPAKSPAKSLTSLSACLRIRSRI